MAKVEIIFEDDPAEFGGKGVIVRCKPDQKTLLAKMKRKESLSPAESLAAHALGRAAEVGMMGDVADKIRGLNKSIIL